MHGNMNVNLWLGRRYSSELHVSTFDAQTPFLTTRYFCRSVEYDEQTHLCVLSEEDSVSQKDDLRTSSSPTHHLYDLVCLDNRECLWNMVLINIL